MVTNHKISIPEPCHEDWYKMTPKGNGRFCGGCAKTVVDFTTMLPDEIQHYFVLKQNKNVCGRFRNTQLDEIIIQIPSRVLYSQNHYHSIFMLALFICMGTTLFSCKKENGAKQKIDKVEVVRDSSEINNTMVGMLLPPKNNTKHVSPPPPPKTEQLKFVKPSTISCGKITPKDSIIHTTHTKGKVIYKPTIPDSIK